MTDTDTLTNHAPYSLKERVKLFHRKFPDARMSVSRLRRLYMTCKVRYKAIRKAKPLMDYTKELFQHELHAMTHALGISY